MGEDRAKRLAELNDRLRCRHLGGRVMMTRGIAAKGLPWLSYALAKISVFDRFDPDNDPYHEHDFGSLEILGVTVFWKIDTFADDNLTYGADDPLSPETVRIMTVMLAEEY